MKKKPDTKPYKELRLKAEELLNSNEEQNSKELSEEVKRLLHELNVHQVELEMQNEELRDTQEKLELSRTKYRELFDFAPVGYFSVDERTMVKEVNFTGCFFVGTERKFLLNTPLIKFIAPDFRITFNDLIKKALETGLKQTSEIRVIGNKQIEFFVALECIAIDSENGKLFLIAMIDITSRKKIEIELRKLNEELEMRIQERTKELTVTNLKLQSEIAEREKSEVQLIKILAELQRSNKELEEFAYVVSHDLQEPLRMIASFTSLLSKKIPDNGDPDTKEFMDFIIDAALRMQQLITGILHLSRVTTRGTEFQPVNSGKTLQNAMENLHSAIQNSGAEITYDSMPEIIADPVQIEQLFQNLISNAIKYRNDKYPVIHISARKEDGEWIFCIKDNGIGINPEFHERIFKIFQRLHTRNEYEGIGIGLAICLKIIQRHKGRIWVESDEGKGSTFYFTIPML